MKSVKAGNAKHFNIICMKSSPFRTVANVIKVSLKCKRTVGFSSDILTTVFSVTDMAVKIVYLCN